MFQDKKLRKEFEEFKKQTGSSSRVITYPFGGETTIGGDGDLGRLNQKKLDKTDIVECDTCGCLIYKDRAISKKVIEERKKQRGGFYVGAGGFMSSKPIEEVAEEVCITKYFCRRCGRKFAKNKVKNEKKN